MGCASSTPARKTQSPSPPTAPPAQEQEQKEEQPQQQEQRRAPFPGLVVADVPAVPEAEAADFRKRYLNNDKVGKDDPRHADLAARDVEIQFARWAWAHANTSTYVNMLRMAGHSDADIQDCVDGVRPLCFPQPLYAEFKESLRQLAADLESAMGWRRVRFAQMGSSVVGYSSNPFKGFEEQPSKITDPASSDVDMYVIAEGIHEWAELCRAEGKPFPDKEYPTTTTLEEGTGCVRYRVPDFADVCPSLAAWHDAWSARFGGGIQLTLRRKADPTLAPWHMLIAI